MSLLALVAPNHKDSHAGVALARVISFPVSICLLPAMPRHRSAEALVSCFRRAKYNRLYLM